MTQPSTASVVSDCADHYPQLDAENRAVMSHYQSLRSTITSLSSSLNNDWSKEEVTKALQQIQQATDGFGKYLALHLQPRYYNEVRQEDSTVATTTLNIPELLELILRYADHRDIVSMAQVSREIKNAIAASLKLQVRLYLKATEVSRFRENKYENVFKYHYPGLMVSTARYGGWTWNTVGADQYGYEGMVDATFSCTGEGNRLPIIGSNWKRMLICQPPTKHMTVNIIYSRSGLRDENQEPISSETGLTVGDLYERAELIITRDISCSQDDSTGVGDEEEEEEEEEEEAVDVPCKIVEVEFKSYDPVQYELDRGYE